MKLAALFLLPIAVLGQADPITGEDNQQICVEPLRTATKIHKTVYKVGVLADRGIEAAFQEFNVTFSDYVTATAGTRFDPPVRFELQPLDFVSLFDDVENQAIDFIYGNPSAYSCIASEYGANSLFSQISKRIVDGKEYDLTKFGVYSRKNPYEGEDYELALLEVADVNINKRQIMPNACPEVIATLMRDCVMAEPQARPSAQEVDLRLKRLDVDNVEPGMAISSLQRKKQAQQSVRSENLLYEVFPKHVVNALRDGHKVEAESFDCATCFFSDIVGYTKISSNLDPLKVSDMLDRLYERFDALSNEYDIFKIDTIGDAYMAVTNIHKNQPDHAARIARFCIDAIKASDETLIDLDDPGKGSVQICCGFHSGPIVADVVGTCCPKYTLFGDTVNTSSRMESTSITGRIQCSDTATALVHAQDSTVNIISRGMIPVKGKGEMETFWIYS